jgi:predicted RNA-binding protein Jag
LDEALSRASAGLRARLGELRYEVGEDEDGGRVAIRAEVDSIAVVGLFLVETCRASELDIKVGLREGADGLEGELSGEDVRLLTASGGQGLDALQYLCNRVLNRRLAEHPPVRLDCAGFKARRARQLEERARAAAEEVSRRGSPVVLGPLTPAARREVHLALANHPAVETESDGEGFFKRVVVRPRRRS